MTCKCGSERIIDVYMKHNDLTAVQIEHLNIDTDGDYLPHIGILGGDSTDLSICLDCGQIQDWEKITDDDIRDNDQLGELLAQGEEEEDDYDEPEDIGFDYIRR